MRSARRLAGIVRRLLGLGDPYEWPETRTVPGRTCRRREPCVLITGGHGTGNVGDEAQLGVNIARWHERLPMSDIKVLSPDPAYTSTAHGVASEWGPRVLWFDSNRGPDYYVGSREFERQFWRVRRRMVWTAWLLRAGVRVQLCTPAESRLLDLVQQADVLHVSGGGILTGTTKSRLWENMLLLRLCHMLGTPVMLTGQTIGVFGGDRDRGLAKWGLAKAKYIGLRDRSESEKEVASIGVAGSQVNSGYDDALFCERVGQADVWAALRQSGLSAPERGYLVANVHFWGLDSAARMRVSTRLAQLCSATAGELRVPVVFVPMARSDAAAERDVMGKMDGTVALAEHGYDYRLVRGIIAESCGVITMRHHPIIFAQGEGVPCLSVALHPYFVRKNGGAMAHFGQEIFALGKDRFYGEGALQVAGEFARGSGGIRAELKRRVAGARPETEAMFDAALGALGNDRLFGVARAGGAESHLGGSAETEARG